MDTEGEYAAVAEWMLQALNGDEHGRSGILYQMDAVKGIRANFGEGYLYTNHNGNPAIDKKVLKAWNRIKPSDIQWEKSNPGHWERK